MAASLLNRDCLNNTKTSLLLNLDCLHESFDNIGVVKLGPVLCICLLCMGLTSVLSMDLLRPVLCIGLCCALVCVVHWSVVCKSLCSVWTCVVYNSVLSMALYGPVLRIIVC